MKTDEILAINTEVLERISKELERLHLKRDEVFSSLDTLKLKIPVMKHNAHKIIKASGLKVNELQKDDVQKAKDALDKAIENYKMLEKELQDIEKSISILEEELS